MSQVNEFVSKKESLDDIVAKAKKQVKKTEKNNSHVNDIYQNERNELEGEQNSVQKTNNELKAIIEQLVSAIEKINARDIDLENKLKEQYIEMRGTYASKAYRFVWLWSIALIIILILDGSQAPSIKLFSLIEIKAHDFQLGESVLIALISGVTINIVAVFFVVIRNLFPSNIKKKNKRK